MSDLNVRPGLAGGIDHGSGVLIDLSLHPDPAVPTGFWQLEATSNHGSELTHSVQISNDSGKVKLRIFKQSGIEVLVVDGGGTLYDSEA